MSELYSELQPFFRQIAPRRITLALSGGRDSSVLLHLLVRARQEYGFTLNAVHIHHGLSTHADAWAEFCERLCKAQDVPLAVHRVRVRPDGQGLEAAARAARYAVFAGLDTDLLALAHHADDQRETFLLAALRGGGTAAMAAMPSAVRFTEKTEMVRPLLAVGRDRIAAYARAYGLACVEDDSNGDNRFLRNWLRNRLIPFAQAHLPHLPQQLDAAVWQAQEDLALLAEWTEADYRTVCAEGFFDCTRWHGFSLPRRRRLLAEFAKRTGLGTPRRASVENFAAVLARNPQQTAEWTLPQGRAYACRGRLFAFGADAAADWPWHTQNGIFSGSLNAALQICGIRPTRRPYGLPETLLQAGGCIRTVRAQDRLAVRGGHKTVKKLLQEHGIPAFMRPYWPVLAGRDGRCLAAVNIRTAEDMRVENGWFPVAGVLQPYIFK